MPAVALMDRTYAAEEPIGAACSWKLFHPAIPLLDAPVITPVLETAPEKVAARSGLSLRHCPAVFVPIANSPKPEEWALWPRTQRSPAKFRDRLELR